jgi:ATP-dependent helicase/nuclease subunit A
VRDPSTPLDAVRVMTVHGSKGLQAPVVILGDACVDPDRSRGGAARLLLEEGGPAVPIFRPKADELCEPLKSQIERQDRLDREEHWRLLYVAMTRAEERLYVGGSLGPGDKKGPPQASWYSAVDGSMDGLGCAWADDPLWGRSRRYGAWRQQCFGRRRSRRSIRPNRHGLANPRLRKRGRQGRSRPRLPWRTRRRTRLRARSCAPQAERGRLLHRLFERLPDVPPDERRLRADAWLRHSAGVEAEETRRELIDRACGIISDPIFADLFTPEALAEAPIAAVTPDGSVVAGTVDRLLIADGVVRLVDFKTGRIVPVTLGEIPPSHLRQMAAYQLALETIFPHHRVEAGLLYTSGPLLHPLPRALLVPFMPAAPLPLEGGGGASYMAGR